MSLNSKGVILEAEIVQPIANENLSEQQRVVVEQKRHPSTVAEQRREAISNFMSNKKEGLKNVLTKGAKSVGGFLKRVGNKALNVAIAPDKYIAHGVEKTKNWFSAKGEQVAKFATEKIELARLTAECIKDATTEKMEKLVSAVEARLTQLEQFGNDSIEAGKNKIAEVKQGLRDRKNSFILSILESIRQKHQAKADSVAAKMALLQTF